MSLNQQGVTGANDTNFDMSFNNGKPFWNTNFQNFWANQASNSTNIYQNQQWPHPVLQSNFQSPIPISHDWIHQTATNQPHGVTQQALPRLATRRFPAENTATNPQARITLIPKTSGGFKASIVKRKRKRTMFTTEQIQTMEMFFRRKPYITKDERQVLVNKLQVSDSAVKVWFQNRRLREKRDKEEREAEILELADSLTEEAMYYSQNNSSFKTSTSTNPMTTSMSGLGNYFSTAKFDINPVTDHSVDSIPTLQFDNHVLNSPYTKTTGYGVSYKHEDSGIESDSSHITNDCDVNSVKDIIEQSEQNGTLETNEEIEPRVSIESSSSPNLDDIEAEIEKKTDEFGYVTLDDKAIGNLVNVLMNILPDDVDLSIGNAAVETVEDSDNSTYCGSIYEPVSPVISDVDDDFQNTRYEPSAPEKSLQKLFDLHFC